jgi:type IX secretion system PorP/SprF family membrane protein
MEKLYTLSFCLFLLFSTVGSSQTSELILPGSNRYLLDNPAGMGVDRQHQIFLGAYKKWYQLDRAPTTFYLASSSPIISRGFGLGGIVVYDEAGLLRTTRLGLNASIHLTPELNHKFSIGAAARYQMISFGLPNAASGDDIIGGLNSSSVNVGFGMNYQYEIGDNNFFNLYAQLTQLPGSSALLKGDQNMDYALAENLIIQANLRMDIGNNVAFTPALRFQAQPTQGYLSKTQMIDASLGWSFSKDKLNLRIGGRMGDTPLLYGAVGIRLSKQLDAYVFIEPGGPFSPSAAFDAAFAANWNEKERSNKIVNTNKEKEKKKEEKSEIKEDKAPGFTRKQRLAKDLFL